MGRGGRPRGFAADEVLTRCLDVFWQRGYEATSLADLEAASGLVRTSLYNAFGAKHDLYAAALQRYLAGLDARLVAPLHDGDAGLADLGAFFDRVETWLAERSPPAGCLVITSMVESAGADDVVRDAGGQLVRRYREAFLAALGRAADAGEVPADSVARRAEMLTGLVLGLNVAARARHTGQVAALLQAGREEARAWGHPVR